MVHALEQAWRVLVPRGIMVDVRPLSVDTPLEIVYPGGKASAGIIDMSPGAELDKDADQAIESVLNDRKYRELNVEYFGFALYWESVKGMQEDIEENWKDEVIITEDVWQNAQTLMSREGQKSQLRVCYQMKLGVYEKNG